MLKENNISLGAIKGTGKQGRIMKEDVLSYLGHKDKKQSKSIPSTPSTSLPASTPSKPLTSSVIII